MALKIRKIYSPNFDANPRKSQTIRFLVFHYTGMKREKEAIQKLTKIQSEVSTHYFIKKNGEIIRMVPDLYVAWHAGISRWKKYKLLNKNSIGIEISNPGHEHGYENFNEEQINSISNITKVSTSDPFYPLQESMIDLQNQIIELKSQVIEYNNN